MSQIPLPGFGAGLGSRLTGLIGNAGIQQFFIWNILSALVNAGLAPVLTAEQQTAWKAAIKAGLEMELDPASLVTAVVRGYLDFEPAADAAAAWGVGRDHFQTLVDSAGNPPAPAELLELWRRGVIPEKGAGAAAVSVEQGIREGQIKDKWIEPFKALKVQLPSPAEALDALLEGQTDRATAIDLFQKWGGDPSAFDLLFNTRGSAPTPLEAAEMARRGIIPWTGTGAGVVSFEQAFLEGPWRNKWEPAYRAVSDYIPPPRATTAMLRNGSITVEQAKAFYSAAGAVGEVADALIKDATRQRTSSTQAASRTTILSLYEEGRFTRDQAKAELVKRGELAEVAELELEEADWRRQKGLIDRAVSRVHSLYVGHRLDKTGAGAALGELKLGKDQVDAMFAVWDVERADNVQVLSVAQVLDLLLIGAAEADVGQMLMDRGYSEQDAVFLIAIKLKRQLFAAPPGP